MANDLNLGGDMDHGIENERALLAMLRLVRESAATSEDDPEFTRRLIAIVRHAQECGGRIESALWTRAAREPTDQQE